MVVFHQENKGVSAARNKGIELATGEFVCFLDSDDTYEPTFLEEMLQHLIKNKGEVICCGFNKITKNITTNNNLQNFLKDEFFPFSSMLLCKKSLLDEKIKFNIEMSIAEDVLFTIQVLTKLNTCFLDRCLFNYIYRKNSCMHDIINIDSRLIKARKGWEVIYKWLENNYHKENRLSVLQNALIQKNIQIIVLIAFHLKHINLEEVKTLKEKLDFEVLKYLPSKGKRAMFFIKNNNPLRLILGMIYYRYIRR